MPGRPNIVFVFSDQHRARTTGYEGAAVATPAMDRLAAEGVVFETAVSSIPVCTPWRAALLTGQYPLTNGVFLNDVRLPTDRPTLGTILTDAGYDTAYIGKWHLDGNRRGAFTPPGPRRQGFRFWAAANCTHDSPVLVPGVTVDLARIELLAGGGEEHVARQRLVAR
ncbi:MAG: sulfatase-like hydrolase/transferase [Spirochaetaceae bacterium]|nr:sulfatase-like hydrolase/transferase [Spirochaetaceae bacterium]